MHHSTTAVRRKDKSGSKGCGMEEGRFATLAFGGGGGGCPWIKMKFSE